MSAIHNVTFKIQNTSTSETDWSLTVSYPDKATVLCRVENVAANSSQSPTEWLSGLGNNHSTTLTVTVAPDTGKSVPPLDVTFKAQSDTTVIITYSEIDGQGQLSYQITDS